MQQAQNATEWRFDPAMARVIDVASLAKARVLVPYGLASTLAFIAMIYKARREYMDEAMAAAWVANSNGCMAIMFNFIAFVLIGSGRVLQMVLLGRLRRQELDTLREAIGIELFDMMVTLTMVFYKFDIRYLMLAGVLMMHSMFQRLCSARMDSMNQVPTVPRHWHVRMAFLFTYLQSNLTVLVPAMILFLLQNAGPGNVMILFATDGIIYQIHLLALMALYACTFYELQQQEPWEAKSKFVSLIEFLRDLAMFLAYPVCYGLALRYVPLTSHFILPFNALRNFALLGYSLYSRVLRYIRFRAATRDMDNKYPALSADEVGQMSDPTCIICREEFTANVSNQGETARRLFCGHVFHLRCLQSWLERQQSCPTCRRDILASPAASSPPQTRPGSGTNASYTNSASTSHTTPSTASTSGASPTMTPLQTLLQRFKQESNVRQASTEHTQSPTTELKSHPVQTESTLDPREAVRQATLKRFGNATSAETIKRQEDTSPSMIPLFNPAQVPNYATYYMPRLPHPLAEWIQPSATKSQAPTENLPEETETRLQTQLRTLEETQQLLQHAMHRVQDALQDPTSPAPSNGKGKEKAREAYDHSDTLESYIQHEEDL